MASNAVRRPLPALIALVALLLLTGLVWWRVINRDDARMHTASKHCATATGTSTASSSSPSTTAAEAPPASALPKPSAVTILVLNSTTRTGIASGARSGLQTAGFRSPRQADNFTGKAKVTGVGQIRYGRGSKDAATLLQYYLPGTTLVRTPSSKPLVTVVLGPKYDGVLSTAQVRKSLTGKATPTSSASKSASAKTC